MPRGITEKTKERKELIYDWACQHNPVTVRQIFYRLSILGEVPKTENGYQIVAKLCTAMRRSGEIPFDWFSDETRWRRQPRTYNTMKDAVQMSALTYRKSLWQSQLGFVEIWLEKEALAGVFYDVTWNWDVPLMVCKGYPSLTFLNEAADEIKKASHKDKKSYLFYFGDYDPTGMHIPVKIEQELRKFAPKADFEFRRSALTAEQVSTWNLPSRPSKKKDPRSKSFGADSAELDAVHPSTLRELIENQIKSVVNLQEWDRLKEVEEQEKASVDNLLRTLETLSVPDGYHYNQIE